MPWWGWLIAFGIVMICATYAFILIYMVKAMERLDSPKVSTQHYVGRGWTGKNAG